MVCLLHNETEEDYRAKLTRPGEPLPDPIAQYLNSNQQLTWTGEFGNAPIDFGFDPIEKGKPLYS